MVLPESQSRGIAVAATAHAIGLAQRDDKHRLMHAFPSVDNAPSNAICRKLGFEPFGACEFEFPQGHLMTCNDWRPDLRGCPLTDQDRPATNRLARIRCPGRWSGRRSVGD